mmetsp:Transcript_15118/g.23920  ORF Transcript_15118/g.23920 Transcript_15118/m.23920 type:complete len:330 (-) Transcript_15118:37-1026(-)
MTDTKSERRIAKIFKANVYSEGAGFLVHRPIGDRMMTTKETDPFLMLDELGPKEYKKGEFKGAPFHPHRGMDTVMYIIKGQGAHQDSMGNKGILKPGDIQWMTAGSGIIHDEGRNHPGGMLHGFQMWVNLPKKMKMMDPAYKTIRASQKPLFNNSQGVKAHVIAGQVGDIEGPIKTVTPIQYIEFILESGSQFTHKIGDEMETAIVYVYEGKGQFQKREADRGTTIKFEGKGTITFKGGPKGVKFLLLAGKPLKEPICWKGPFVMNTEKEIEQAIRDYRTGNLVRVKATELLLTSDNTRSPDKNSPDKNSPEKKSPDKKLLERETSERE